MYVKVEIFLCIIKLCNCRASRVEIFDTLPRCAGLCTCRLSIRWSDRFFVGLICAVANVRMKATSACALGKICLRAHTYTGAVRTRRRRTSRPPTTPTDCETRSAASEPTSVTPTRLLAYDGPPSSSAFAIRHRPRLFDSWTNLLDDIYVSKVITFSTVPSRFVTTRIATEQKTSHTNNNNNNNKWWAGSSLYRIVKVEITTSTNGALPPGATSMIAYSRNPGRLDDYLTKFYNQQ